MPRADDLPSFKVDHSCVTPCTHNPLGVKGCGEVGAIGSPPAVINAVLDALNAGGSSVDAHRHAADAGAGLGGDRRRRGRGGGRCTHSSSCSPSTVAEAVAALGRRGGAGARRRADADPDAEARLAQPATLVGLSGIAGAEGRRRCAAASSCIGGGTTHARWRARRSAHYPALAALAARIGDPQVRNRGTIGGCLANNDPAA